MIFDLPFAPRVIGIKDPCVYPYVPIMTGNVTRREEECDYMCFNPKSPQSLVILSISSNSYIYMCVCTRVCDKKSSLFCFFSTSFLKLLLLVL